MISRSEIMTLSTLNAVLLTAVALRVDLISHFAGQITQLVFELLRAANNRMKDQPDGDRKHSRQYQRNGQYGGWKPWNESCPQEFDCNHQPGDKSQSHQKQSKPSEECER